MAIHLNIKNSNQNRTKTEETKLHWMPCVIKVDGEAKVSEYFEPIIVKRKDGVMQASFRGHPLLGKEINLPRNYTGIVLQEITGRLNEDNRNFYGIQLFDKLTYWNWDVEPNVNDKIIMALEWLEVAEALHAPVDSVME